MLQSFPFLTQIPIYKGADEALIPGDIKRGTHGANGFADVQFWDLNKYPSDINKLIQQKRAVEIIRDLVMEVSLVALRMKY